MINIENLIDTYTETKSIEITAGLHDTLPNIVFIALYAAKYPGIYELFPANHPYHEKVAIVISNWIDKNQILGPWSASTTRLILYVAGFPEVLNVPVPSPVTPTEEIEVSTKKTRKVKPKPEPIAPVHYIPF